MFSWQFDAEREQKHKFHHCIVVVNCDNLYITYMLFLRPTRRLIFTLGSRLDMNWSLTIELMISEESTEAQI